MVRFSCGIQVTRGILFALNIIFVIFGLTLLGFGIWLAASKKFDVAFFEDVNVQIIGGKAIQNIGIALIMIGLITGVLSTLGCVGAWKEKQGLLYTYAIILGLLMAAELAAFITAMVMRVDIRNTYENNLWNIFEDAYVKNKTDIRNAVEKLEKQFECCGVDDPHDYASINLTIPSSCYKNPENFEDLYTLGCADAIIDWIWDELPKIGGVIGGVIFLEFFGLIASISMGVAISHYSYGQIYAQT